jgi:hypothetical protein
MHPSLRLVAEHAADESAYAALGMHNHYDSGKGSWCWSHGMRCALGCFTHCWLKVSCAHGGTTDYTISRSVMFRTLLMVRSLVTYTQVIV